MKKPYGLPSKPVEAFMSVGRVLQRNPDLGRDASVDRANFRALGAVEVTFAFNAGVCVDYVYFTLCYGADRAFRQTNSTCYAIFCDLESQA